MISLYIFYFRVFLKYKILKKPSKETQQRKCHKMTQRPWWHHAPVELNTTQDKLTGISITFIFKAIAQSLIDHIN